jgi:hypothetical protein
MFIQAPTCLPPQFATIEQAHADISARGICRRLNRQTISRTCGRTTNAVAGSESTPKGRRGPKHYRRSLDATAASARAENELAKGRSEDAPLG